MHIVHCARSSAAAQFELASNNQILAAMESYWEEYQSYCQQKDQQPGWRWYPIGLGPDNGSGPEEHIAPKKKPVPSKRRPVNQVHASAEKSHHQTSATQVLKQAATIHLEELLPDGSLKPKEELLPRQLTELISAQRHVHTQPSAWLPFPAASSRRAGTVEDLSVHRISRAVNQAFLDSLPRMGPFTAKQVQALMSTFFTTRVGYEGEDLQRRLEHATVSPTPRWCRFAIRTETPAFEAPPQLAYHGSHPEALHALIALGKLVPSSEHVQGARYFEGRAGVYLHSSESRSKAEGYSVHVRWGKPHVYIAVLLETLYDASQSLKPLPAVFCSL